MAPTVELDEESVSLLDELRAVVERETGVEVSRQDVLAQIVSDALDDSSAVVGTFRESTVPLSEAERERMHEWTFSSGVGTDEDDIDEILYGDEHNPSARRRDTPSR